MLRELLISEYEYYLISRQKFSLNILLYFIVTRWENLIIDQTNALLGPGCKIYMSSLIDFGRFLKRMKLNIDLFLVLSSLKRLVIALPLFPGAKFKSCRNFLKEKSIVLLFKYFLKICTYNLSFGYTYNNDQSVPKMEISKCMYEGRQRALDYSGLAAEHKIVIKELTMENERHATKLDVQLIICSNPKSGWMKMEA